MTNWKKSVTSTAHWPPRIEYSDHDQADDDHADVQGEPFLADGRRQEDPRRQDAEGVVDEAEGQPGPDHDLVDEPAEALLHEPEGRHHPGPAPAVGEKEPGGDHDGNDGPGDDHGHQAVLEGDLRIDDKKGGAERSHPQGDSGKPPGHGGAGGEVVLGFLDVLPEIDADKNEDGEIAQQDDVIGSLKDLHVRHHVLSSEWPVRHVDVFVSPRFYRVWG